MDFRGYILECLQKVQRLLGKPEDASLISPQAIRQKQLLMLASTAFVGGGLVYAFVSWRSESSADLEAVQKPVVTTPQKLATPLEAIDQRELWVNRVEKKAHDIYEEAEKVRKENELLEKRVDVLEDLWKHQSLAGGNLQEKSEPKESQDPIRYSQDASSSAAEAGGLAAKSEYSHATMPGATNPSNNPPRRRTGAKIARLSKVHGSSGTLKTVDTYVPATTTCKAVMTSGVVVQAGAESENKPEPVTLRLVDDGTLPRGFTSRVKNAEINAACYGNISSERVKCRLVTMTWVEPNGVIVEKNVEGWIYGEDGRNGLRGTVVDRSSEVAREAYFAGVLSGFSNFFKFESTSSVYPVSPFGVTNALNAPQALQGAAASGAGNALEKLADTSIRRLEQMQPVIVTNAGRLVDVRFKTGFSLDAEPDSEMKVMGKSPKEEGES
ncbi:TrbI/VirB10 family protein [Candidatus Odyssella thessalonicensis]|uniref:TrbI/VirB10 family protein n=1 Tax=Candidatus Odyssella thessalonicensis TaxID=84647 RepID=UPI000225B984|nr:TrbI/VirB10 family protein [Candidatus Odyssella thessalonicensis]